MIRMFTFAYLGFYNTLIRYISISDAIKMVKGATISTILIVVLTFFLGERSHPRSVFFIDWFILICLLGGSRLFLRTLREYLQRKKSKPKRNILIYGAGDMGELALGYLRRQNKSQIVGFVDDDPKKRRKYFQGLKILGNRHDIAALAQLYHINEVLVAISNLSRKDLGHIHSLCEKVNVRCEVFRLKTEQLTIDS